jgi:hypothetical protein
MNEVNEVKEKKPRTEKQLKAFEKARNVLLEKRKNKIEQELNGSEIVKPKPESKKKEIIEKIPEPPKIEPPKKVKIEKEPESESEPEEEPVQQIIYKKKPKPKVVYITDSESETDDAPPPPPKKTKKTVAPPPTPQPVKKVNPYISMLNNSSRF